MTGTALDHRLVRDYLRELDAAMRGLPAAQARELKEQITAHLDDALPPDAGDQEVAATLSRLGSPAGLTAEAEAASGSSGPRLALSSRRVRWRLAAVIAVPTVIAAVLGALQISSDASNDVTAGRVQHLAQLNAAVVKLTQNLEDERDLSAAYVASGAAGPVPVTLAHARTATDGAASTVQADAAGGGTGDASLQDTVTTLAALLGVENEQSVQRAILYAALSAQPPALAPEDLTSLQQAAEQEQADLADFNAAASTTEQQRFSNTVSGAAVDRAAAQEDLAEQAAAANPRAPLTGNTGLDAATWYGDMSTTIGDTRKVASQLTGQLTIRANTLKSNATRRLLLTSIVTLVLLLLVLLISAVLTRPLRKPRSAQSRRDGLPDCRPVRLGIDEEWHQRGIDERRGRILRDARGEQDDQQSRDESQAAGQYDPGHR